MRSMSGNADTPPNRLHACQADLEERSALRGYQTRTRAVPAESPASGPAG